MTLRSTITAMAAAALAAGMFSGQAAAQTPPASETGRDCFYSGAIRGFSAVDDETVNIRVGTREVYQLKLFSPSNDIRWTNGIALVSHGGSFICSKLDASVVVPGGIGQQRFPLQSIRKLTVAEVEALPRNQRP